MRSLALIVLAALALPSFAAAAESTTPYAALYQVLSPVRDIGRYDRLAAIERVESKTPGVDPKDIRIVIHAKGGDIAVPVGAGGFAKFPVTDALRDENPPVETNQEKGSLALIVNVAIKVDGLRMPWSDVEAALTQVKAFYAESRGGTAPAISGVEAYFSPGREAMLTIEGKSERLLMADASGRVIVTREQALENAAPVLSFSRAPDFIVPYADDKP